MKVIKLSEELEFYSLEERDKLKFFPKGTMWFILHFRKIIEQQFVKVFKTINPMTQFKQINKYYNIRLMFI